jgi:putative addiction module component (TIGR02574 family)
MTERRSFTMADFNSVLEHARKLSPQDQARLIDALWDAVPDDVDIPLHPDWESELERRINELKARAGATIPWSQIRAAALARIGHGSIS